MFQSDLARPVLLLYSTIITSIPVIWEFGYNKRYLMASCAMTSSAFESRWIAVGCSVASSFALLIPIVDRDLVEFIFTEIGAPVFGCWCEVIESSFGYQGRGSEGWDLRDSGFAVIAGGGGRSRPCL